MSVVRYDRHSVLLVSSVAKLYENSELTDCVLDTKGGFICAHKTILASCSPYMKNLMMNQSETTILSFKEVEHKIMKLILDILYYGEVEVPASSMALFIQTAKLLQIMSLRCDSPNISETFSTINTGGHGTDNHTTSCGMNHLKNNERYPPVIENGVKCNQSLLNKSSFAFKNIVERSIHSSETETSNIFEEVSGRVNKDHPIPNSKEIVGYKESRDGVRLQDELNPISFVAVPSVSVKSEEVCDEQSLSCISDMETINPLEELPYNNDWTNEINVQQKQNFSTESKVSIENKDKITDMVTMKGLSRSITSAVKPSLNQLSTSVVDDVLTDTEPTNSSLIGHQKDKNTEPDCTRTSKFKLKMTRVVLTRIKPLHTTLHMGNAVNIDSSSLISLPETVNSEEVGEAEVVSSCIRSQQNKNEELNKACVSKLKLKDARVVLTLMKPLNEEDQDSEYSGLKRSHLSSGAREKKESAHVQNLSEENLSNKIEERSIESSRSHILCHMSKKRFSCYICQKSLANKTNLKLHMRIHSGEKPHSCDICKASFRQLSHLIIHQRTHTGEKPYSCDVCKASFASKGYLNIHMRIHSRDTPFSCDECKASFTLRGQLKVHKRTHTGKRDFTCNICQKCFAPKTNLKIHMRIHTGEKPHSCDICKASFRQLSHLINHQRTHTGEKPYSCDVCEASFKQKSNLLIHQRNHHGKPTFSM